MDDINVKLYEASDFYLTGKHSDAMEIYKDLALQGHKEAQDFFVTILTDRESSCYDISEGMNYAVEFAENGNDLVQFTLAQLYYHGSKISKDDSKAYYWYKCSAEQNNSGAQCMVGYMILNGLTVDVNIPLAIGWFEKAAQNGDIEAMANLYCIYSGQFGEKYYDNAKFLTWLSLACQSGDAPSQYLLGTIYFNNANGDDEIMQKGIELIRKAASQGNENAVAFMRKLAKK